MLELTTVKVSEKGQIAIPVKVRDDMRIKKGDTLIIIQEGEKMIVQKANHIKSSLGKEFNHLLKHADDVAKRFWGTKADDVWDNV